MKPDFTNETDLQVCPSGAMDSTFISALKDATDANELRTIKRKWLHVWHEHYFLMKNFMNRSMP